MAVAGDRVKVHLTASVVRFGNIVDIDGSNVAKILLECLPPTDGPALIVRGWRICTKRSPIIFIESVPTGAEPGQWESLP